MSPCPQVAWKAWKNSAHQDCRPRCQTDLGFSTIWISTNWWNKEKPQTSICLCHSLSLHVFYTWLYTCNLHHIKSASNLSCHSSARIIWVPNQWSATLLADAQCCWPSKSSKITRHEECSNFAIILFDLLSLLLRIDSISSRGTFRFFSSIATQKHGLAMWGLQSTLTQGGQSAIYLMHKQIPKAWEFQKKYA